MLHTRWKTFVITAILFRYKYRKHLPVVAAVGMLSGADGGGRNKAFYTIELYKSHYDCDVSYEELNDVLAEPLDPHKLGNYIKGVEDQLLKISTLKNTISMGYVNGLKKLVVYNLI